MAIKAKSNATLTDEEIDAQLFGGGDATDELLDDIPDAEVFSLDAPAADAPGVNMADFSLGDERATSPVKIVKTLKGADALTFLGLPARPQHYLKRGDFRRIYRKFKPLFEEWEDRVKNDRSISLSASAHFWRHIKIRVWLKANLAKLDHVNGPVGLPVGMTYPLGSEPAKYEGDVYDGNAISTFLSEKQNSERWREYFVQLESIDVTEDMRSYA